MLEKLIEWKKIHFPNYKEMYNDQNEKIDQMTAGFERKKAELKNIISDQKKENMILKNELDDKSVLIDTLEEKISTIEKEKNILNKNYNTTLKKLNENVIQLKKDKRILSSSKGGLMKKVRILETIKKELLNENKEIKSLIQSIVKESGRKLTPPTIQELKNYKLFGNREGIKKCQK